MRPFSSVLRFLTVLALLAASAVPTAEAVPRGGLAMHGAPALGDGDAPLSYTNPDAPKGGRLTLGERGSFDSLNPFVIKGRVPEHMRGYVFESLMVRAGDEPFSLYGLIASSVDLADDRSAVTFTLRPEARFSDGTPITSADVVFSFELLRDKGWPFYRTYFGKAASIEARGPRAVHIAFKRDEQGEFDRELPLIVAIMPVLPKHKIDPATFAETTLAPMIGSGPYVIGAIDTGRSILYNRDPNWWGRDLPVNRGRFNFDEIAIDYFGDETALFEAFKSGRVDFRYETDPSRWTKGYEFPALKDGTARTAETATRLPAGMAALVFNTRRPMFKDPRVRRALINLFDFEWINGALFNGLYARSQSYFARSDLASTGKPADARERTLLAPWIAQLRPELLDGTYALPVTDGRGNPRGPVRRALADLTAAGYTLKGTTLVHAATGVPLAFEFLARDKAQERLILAYARTLAEIGIKVTVRSVDDAQFWLRTKTFDFDMMQWAWPASLSPGNELTNRFASAAAASPGSQNFAGIADPAADAMIAALLAATDPQDFRSAVRALDRVLLNGDYVIPLYHLPNIWFAHWTNIKRPEKTPLSGIDISTWWAEGTHK